MNADAETLENCREPLAEVQEEWILPRVSRNRPLPVLDGVARPVRITDPARKA